MNALQERGCGMKNYMILCVYMNEQFTDKNMKGKYTKRGGGMKR